MIDAAIPLQQQAPNFLGQLSSLQNVGIQQGNMQAQQQQSQLRDIGIQSDQLKLNSETQSVQDQAHVRAATAAATDPQTGQVSRPMLLSTLGKLDPYLAAQTSQNLTSQDRATEEAKMTLQNAQLGHATLVNTTLDKVLQGVNNQATWTNALQSARQIPGMDPNILSQLPEQYDPQLVQRLHQQVLSTQQVLAQKNEEATQAETAKKDTATAAQAAATAAQTASNEAAQRRQEQQRIGLEGARVNMERQKQQMEMGTGTDANSLSDAIASGHIAPDRMAYLLAKNPGLIQAVMQKDPSFDSSKASAYATAYKDFTSSKTNTAGGALNAGGTALGHLNELSNMNTPSSHIPGTPDYNAYQNKADTVASELAKFYGDATIPAIAAIKKTLTATLPGNRMAAIRTQAQSMGDKFDSYQQTWENAAPSKAYEAPMPGVSPAAMAARAALDPRYKAPQGARPTGGGGMVTMKAPNGQTTQVPADQVEHFKSKGATVVK